MTYDNDGTPSAREIALVAPMDFDEDESYPVYFLFHGSGGNKQSTIGVCLKAIMNNKNVLCVAISGGQSFDPTQDGGFWNLGQGQTNEDDEALVLGLWEQISVHDYVNKDRVYAMGFSMGSALAGNVLTVSPCSPFRGVVQVASQLWVDTVIETPNAMDVLLLHGDADTLIPYQGGQSPVGATFMSIDDTMAAWAAHNGCFQGEPSVEDTDEFIQKNYPASL